MAPPDFANRTLFPSFANLPASTTLSDTTGSSSPSHYLIGQVKENMTITNPTLIITDLSGVDLAVTFAATTFDVSHYRKGKTCIVVPDATRTAPAQEGKKGFVRVAEGEEQGVRLLPGKMEVLARLQALEGDGERTCWAEGCEEEAGSRCLGCKTVKYCGKDCQVKSWAEGHKSECKMFKAVDDIWGE